MTTPRSLGKLSILRIWHDNSGKGNLGSWYLDKIAVKDLQTGDTFFFLCQSWLAVDEGDGLVDRVVPVASLEELTSFSELFSDKSKKSLTDAHLWVSVFVRLGKSHYTRLQRLSVVIAVMYLTMLVNAMWYGTEPETSTNIELGLFSISTFQLYVRVIILTY